MRTAEEYGRKAISRRETTGDIVVREPSLYQLLRDKKKKEKNKERNWQNRERTRRNDRTFSRGVLDNANERNYQVTNEYEMRT